MHFGATEHVARLSGRLITNQDIVVVDVDVEKVFPGRDIGFARFAIVGMHVADVPEDRYSRATVQVTGADMLFGALPFASFGYPGRPDNPPRHYSVTLCEETSWRWCAAGEIVEVVCEYAPAATINRYGFEVSMRPVVVLESAEPLTLAEWVDRWIVPLVEAASFATRHAQQVAALSVSTAGEERTTGAVFGPGIAQAPYYSSDGSDWMTGPKALFSLAQLPVNFADLLVGWRRLQIEKHPFVELYRLVLMTSDLPPRAKLLYLLQALEALHGFEHQHEDDEAQDEFEQRRQAALDEIKALCDSKTAKFVKGTWAKRRPDSLARRLQDLLTCLPDVVSDELGGLDLSALGGDVTGPATAALEEQLQTLRNDLSHGRTHSAEELEPWVVATEILCQASFLRLLGFDNEAITKSITGLARN